MKAAIESAKAQLETQTHMLTDLLQKIGEKARLYRHLQMLFCRFLMDPMC